MKKYSLKTIGLLIAILFATSFFTSAQNVYDPEEKWGKSISQYEKQDSISFPKNEGILLLGSSSFTKWKEVSNDFPGKNIINRGFGGSQMSDVLYFKNRLILPYRPEQLVIYLGENDIVAGEMPDSILSELIQLVNWTKNQLPGIRISVVSMKPCPLRWDIRESLLEMNELFKQFASENENIDYINIWDPLLGPEGKPVKDNYMDDSLHLNANGYKIWKEAMAPFLE